MKTFTKENLIHLELRRARAKALRAIESNWPSAPKLVERYNKAADTYNNFYPAYPLGKV